MRKRKRSLSPHRSRVSARRLRSGVTSQATRVARHHSRMPKPMMRGETPITNGPTPLGAGAQETYSIREQAQRDHQAIEEEIRTSRRPFKLPDDRVPHDRHAAARRAAETRLNADAIQTQATTAERERSVAEEHANQAKA